jgi:hypothetical protein
MSKNPQDRNRMPGEGEGGEEMENMPKKDEKGMDPKKGQQTWKQGQPGEQGGQPRKGDEMNRPKNTDEDADDRKKRPA